MKKVLVLSIISIFFTSCEKHVQGCIDPLAINYNPEATCDDGSCEYLGDQ